MFVKCFELCLSHIDVTIDDSHMLVIDDSHMLVVAVIPVNTWMVNWIKIRLEAAVPT